ncbi:transcription termination factor 1-like isoform X2 [Anneissia japonica]|uniref:transcription termination factor 1-like isoform X1 n=1 Tax=Anneissia japonica TaxID=1529436 RepID=UPI0014256549|nr:transcription termination factor 1-like isoform X1 [Anneissia japonica]XP_033099128.1 transcription termination factor 1-like isoform X2 [Anneissia japonica]
MKRKHNLTIVNQEISKDDLSLKPTDHFLDNSEIKIKKKKRKKHTKYNNTDKDGEKDTLLPSTSDSIDIEPEQNEETKKKKRSIVNQDNSKIDLSLKTADHFTDNSEITIKKKRKKHTKYENKDKDGEQNTLLTNSDTINNGAEQNEDLKMEMKKKKKSDHCEMPGEVQREGTKILEQFDKSVKKPAKKKHKKHKHSHDRIKSSERSLKSDELLISKKTMETHAEDDEEPPRSTKKKSKKHKQTIHIESEEIIKHDVNEDATEDHMTVPDDHITPPDDPTISSSRQYPASIKDYYTASTDLSLDHFLEGGFATFPSAQLHDFGIWESITKETTVKLQEKGMQIQTGMWRKWEDEILKGNMQKFCEEVNIYDVERLVFPNLNTEDKKAILPLIKEKQMYHKLGNGINRPLRNIYYRCRKLFDKNNYKGVFSDHEVKTILRLQNKYGNKWIKIGRLIERSGPSIQSKIRFGIKDKTIGAWSKKERKQLIKAVKEHVSEDAGPEAWYYNIPWEKVQKKVPTRESRQCRGEWLMILSSLAQGTMAPELDSWDKSDNVQLIERIYEMNIHDEEEIDWLALMPEFEKAVSPQKLRYRWYIIKSTYVPRHSYKTLDEILDYVGDEVLPKLREQVKKMKRKKKEKRKRKLQVLRNQCNEESDTVN